MITKKLKQLKRILKKKIITKAITIIYMIGLTLPFQLLLLHLFFQVILLIPYLKI